MISSFTDSLTLKLYDNVKRNDVIVYHVYIISSGLNKTVSTDQWTANLLL